MLAIAGVPPGWASATFALGAFVLGTVVQEFWRGVRARQAMLHESAPRALGRLVNKNRRRYCGYIIHVGVVDLRTGDLLWMNSEYREGSTNLRDPNDAAKMVNAVFDWYPGIEQYRAAYLR